MPISDVHPDYSSMAGRWERCRDVAGGSDSVKAKAGRYLPKPPGQNFQDYAAFLARALFYNAMSRTVDGLAGAIFQKAPTVTASKAVEGWLGDITLADETLDGVALRITREILTVGRAVALVDWSDSASRPYVAVYDAEALIHWTTERRGGDHTLTRAVFREAAVQSDEEDPSSFSTQEQYRESVLTAEGVYQQRVHVRLPQSHLRDRGNVVYIAGDWLTPTRRGTPLSFIPLTIFGASRLGSAVERPPLVDLADVNLSHYRSSADREAALHWVSMPTPWVSGAKGDGPLLIGSSVAWNLEKDGRAGMLEHSGEGIGAIRESMAEKQTMMASLGARLLEEQPKGAETATAVSMRHAGEHATLRTIAQVAEAGLTAVLRMMGWWAGTESTPKDVPATVELNKEFISHRMSPEELKAYVFAWQSEAISRNTMHYNLERGDVMRPGVTSGQELKAIEIESPDGPSIGPRDDLN